MKDKIKNKMMAFESHIHSKKDVDLEDSIMANIPADAFVIDERKIPNSVFSFMYIEKYAQSLGFPDDKIYLIHECYYLKHQDRVYHKKGSMFDGNVNEFNKKYKDLGIHIGYEKNPSGDDS